MRPGSGIPTISTAHTQAQDCCAQIIHIFVHSQQDEQSSCRAGRQQLISAGGCGDIATGLDARLPSLAPMRSCQELSR